MNRREFLHSLAVLLAASQFPGIETPVVAQEPVIDWMAWNFIEAKAIDSQVTVHVNGFDITPFPRLLQDVSQILRVDVNRGCIEYGPPNHPSTSWIKITDGEGPLFASCAVKVRHWPSQTMDLDDLYVAGEGDLLNHSCLSDLDFGE